MAAKLKAVTESVGIDWRAHLRDVHGILIAREADDYPMLNDDELRRLGHSIITKGLAVPVVLYAPGRGDDGEARWLIDGRNRFASLALVLHADEFAEHVNALLGEAGSVEELRRLYGWLGPRQVDDEEVKGDVKTYVDNLNLHRRHLPREDYEKRIAVVEAAIIANPGRSDRSIAREAGTSPTVVGKSRAKLEAADPRVHVDTRTDSKGRKQPSTKASRLSAAKPPQQHKPAAIENRRDAWLAETSHKLSAEPKTALNELRMCIHGSAAVARLEQDWRIKTAREFALALGVKVLNAETVL